MTIFKNNVFYGLEGVSADIWHLLQEPKPVDEICSAILQKYELARERCERDVRTFQCELAGRGLIRVDSELPRSNPAIGCPEPRSEDESQASAGELMIDSGKSWVGRVPNWSSWN